MNKNETKNVILLLTDVELELMTILWSLGKAPIKEVVAHLPKDRNLAYTTVATVVKILEQKGFLRCDKDTYAHMFSPLISKSEYEKNCLDHMITNVFDGAPVALVQRLLDSKKLQANEIEAIKEALSKLTPRGK